LTVLQKYITIVPMPLQTTGAAERVDIRKIELPWHWYSRAICDETVLLDDTPVAIELRAVQYSPTIKDAQGWSEHAGVRLMFGAFVRAGDNVRLIQHIAGPQQFSVSPHHFDLQLQQERRILELIAQQLAPDFVTMPLPHAYQARDVIYESTAPGIRMDEATEVIANAYANGELTEEDTSLLLEHMRDSAYSAIASLHSIGIKHNHAHPRNFNIDLVDGSATIFDYTIAVSTQARDTEFMADNGLVTAERMEDDFLEFETKWQALLLSAAVSHLDYEREPDETTRNMALSKLLPMVVRRALREVGVDQVTDQAVVQVIEAQGRLISNAPDISYPKNTLRQRLRGRWAMLLANFRQ
jgi:hypothetical protein